MPGRRSSHASAYDSPAAAGAGPDRPEERDAHPVERPSSWRSMLAGGTASEDGKSVLATTAIIMKKSDVAEKQQREREDWQKNGVGGVVKAVDAAADSITLSTGTLGAPNTTAVQVPKTPSSGATLPTPSSSTTPSRARSTRSKPAISFAREAPRAPTARKWRPPKLYPGTFRSIPGLWFRPMWATTPSRSPIWRASVR